MPSPSLTGPELAPTSGTVKQLVILLHGLGSNGDDLISLAPLLAAELPDTQFLSPHAPFAFDQAPFGYQWFSLRERVPAVMLEGAKTATPLLDAYIDASKKRFAVEDARVALLGFSQGSMMALYAGLRRAQPLAGIVGFSGALLGADSLPASATPVCLIHGARDEVVPFAAMENARVGLEKAGIAVETHASPQLGHSIDEQGLDAAIAFLRRVFAL